MVLPGCAVNSVAALARWTAARSDRNDRICRRSDSSLGFDALRAHLSGGQLVFQLVASQEAIISARAIHNAPTTSPTGSTFQTRRRISTLFTETLDTGDATVSTFIAVDVARTNPERGCKPQISLNRRRSSSLRPDATPVQR